MRGCTALRTPALREPSLRLRRQSELRLRLRLIQFQSLVFWTELGLGLSVLMGPAAQGSGCGSCRSSAFCSVLRACRDAGVAELRLRQGAGEHVRPAQLPRGCRQQQFPGAPPRGAARAPRVLQLRAEAHTKPQKAVWRTATQMALSEAPSFLQQRRARRDADPQDQLRVWMRGICADHLVGVRSCGCTRLNILTTQCYGQRCEPVHSGVACPARADLRCHSQHIMRRSCWLTDLQCHNLGTAVAETSMQSVGCA